MLLRYLELLFAEPLTFLRLLVAVTLALVVAISVHEFSHAFVAYRLGDDTPKRMGRLSLNPLVHLDPIGTILIFLVGFGWGKPVPVNAYYLRGGVRQGMAKVAFAGPLAGLLTAAFLGAIVQLVELPSAILYILRIIITINVFLSLFNLLPLPPLDGYHVVKGLLPWRLAYSYSRLENYGVILLIGFIFLDLYTGLNILGRTLIPAAEFLIRLFSGRGLF